MLEVKLGVFRQAPDVCCPCGPQAQNAQLGAVLPGAWAAVQPAAAREWNCSSLQSHPVEYSLRTGALAPEVLSWLRLASGASLARGPLFKVRGRAPSSLRLLPPTPSLLQGLIWKRTLGYCATLLPRYLRKNILVPKGSSEV